MYPRSATRLLEPHSLARLDIAYEDKKKPIGWWEPNKEVTGLIQAYLVSLGYELPKSMMVVNDGGGKTIVTDGIFGKETFDAVRAFQTDNHLSKDGMVGKETLDALARLLDPPRPASN